MFNMAVILFEGFLSSGEPLLSGQLTISRFILVCL